MPETDELQLLLSASSRETSRKSSNVVYRVHPEGLVGIYRGNYRRETALSPAPHRVFRAVGDRTVSGGAGGARFIYFHSARARLTLSVRPARRCIPSRTRITQVRGRTSSPLETVFFLRPAPCATRLSGRKKKLTVPFAHFFSSFFFLCRLAEGQATPTLGAHDGRPRRPEPHAAEERQG